MNQFKAGDKVVCVGADSIWSRCSAVDGETVPTVGATYTIRNIFICPRQNVVGIRLEEIINPEVNRAVADHNGSKELGFRASLFRPIQKRTTSIEVFRALLNPTKVDA